MVQADNYIFNKINKYLNNCNPNINDECHLNVTNKVLFNKTVNNIYFDPYFINTDSYIKMFDSYYLRYNKDYQMRSYYLNQSLLY